MRLAVQGYALGAAAAFLPLAALAQSEGYIPLTVNGVESEHDRLERAQFEPIAQVASAKRSVRRVTYRDPFGNPNAPGVSIEKAADGSVTFIVTANGGKVKEEGKLTAQEWASLTALDAALAPPKAAPMHAKGEVCHAKLMVIEAADSGKSRRRNASMCGGEADYQAIAYAYKVAELVLGKISRCETFTQKDREPSWRLHACLRT